MPIVPAQEAEAERSLKFKANLDLLRPCLKKMKKTKNQVDPRGIAQ